jgi:glycosyltransferase involved in cell wall biosynthesis
MVNHFSAPLVSIFIVSYNQEEFIEETLDSAFNQDYPNIQVVISDDASTDRTAEIIKAYKQKRSELVTIFNTVNLGITKNCNVCLSKCTGKYIAFLGGDDLFLPGKISAQVKWFEESDNRVICGHDCEIFDNLTKKVLAIDVPYRKKGYGVKSWIEDGMILSAQTLMIRNDARPNIGFDERVEIVADWKFFIDILLKGGESGYIPGIYSKYRKHSSNITLTSSKYMTAGYKQSLLDQLYTLSYIEAYYPEFSRSCKVRRKKLFYARLIMSFRNKDKRVAKELLNCFTVNLFSVYSTRALSNEFKSWIYK